MKASDLFVRQHAKAIAEHNGMTEADVLALTKSTRAKYGNRKTTVGDRVFDSAREARRYLELAMLQGIGEIADLECQPWYDLHVAGGAKAARFTLDFRYRIVKTGEVVVEDVKSKATRTTAYMMRKRWLLAEHGIAVREIF
jgi:hypothetical protein